MAQVTGYIRRCTFWRGAVAFVLALLPLTASADASADRSRTYGDARSRDTVQYGAYLARIGACEACHTAPRVPANATPLDLVQMRARPDWTRDLDPARRFAGGVPFIIRFSSSMSGVVVSRNLTPDPATGLGTWSVADIVRALKAGKRRDGSDLFIFPPHVFYRNLSDNDAYALAYFLKSLPAVTNRISDRQLPFPPTPVPASAISRDAYAPTGSGIERGRYLTSALVGCVECHSHRLSDGVLRTWQGGHPDSKVTGAFRLGPDLPLTQNERGLATWPFPGYAMLLAPNLTEYGVGGPHARSPVNDLTRAIREGIAPEKDRFGRVRPLSHTMLWEFYADMSDEDVQAIVRLMQSLRYVPAYSGPRLIHFGADWQGAFGYMFGEPPSGNDRAAFGKPPS